MSMTARQIVLLGHGSPDPRAAEGLRLLAANVAAVPAIGSPVTVAFLSHAKPDLPSAVAACAATGAEEVVVVPIFLSTAHHVRVDVPAAVEQAQHLTGLRVTTTRPIGPDARLIDAMERELPADRTVILATAGTSDEAAQRDLLDLAGSWQERRSTPVLLAFASQAEPDVAEAIDAARAHLGDEPVVASFVLFDGLLPDRIRDAAQDLPVSTPIGSAPETALIVADRIAAACA